MVVPIWVAGGGGGEILPPGDIWKFLEMFLIVMTDGMVCAPGT